MNRISQFVRRLALAAMITLFVMSRGVAGETITFFHNDIAGSPMLATDVNGLQVWKETYRPYGDRLIDASASVNNDVWFTGKSHDEDTGLSYFGARYYDPTLGRFMGVDPVRVKPDDVHAFNRYAYAKNNPVKYVDPDGRDAVLINYKGYMVNTGIQNRRLPLGHAGVLLIDDDSGHTRYYEFGRYSPNDPNVIGKKLSQLEGNVRRHKISDAVIGEDGRATKESLEKIYGELSKVAGQGKDVDAAYFDDADYQGMLDHIGEVASDPERDGYGVLFNNCEDFAEDVVDAGQEAEDRKREQQERKNDRRNN